MSTLQLYSLATPNGQKAAIALEEMGLSYEAHTINIFEGDQFKPEFIKINPNSKIPALVDPEGDRGQPLTIMESGAILIYLAEKSGMFLSQDSVLRNKTLQWLFFQVGHIGPMFGQFGHFYKYAKENCDHPYPTERYTKESKRLLSILDSQLEGQNYLVSDEMSIADIATAPWVHCLDHFYKASDQLDLKSFTNVNQWLNRFLNRPLVQTGMKVCSL
jgi:GST-like protein